MTLVILTKQYSVWETYAKSAATGATQPPSFVWNSSLTEMFLSERIFVWSTTLRCFVLESQPRVFFTESCVEVVAQWKGHPKRDSVFLWSSFRCFRILLRVSRSADTTMDSSSGQSRRVFTWAPQRIISGAVKAMTSHSDISSTFFRTREKERKESVENNLTL